MYYVRIIMQGQLNGCVAQMIKALCWYKAQVRKLTLNLGKARVVPQIKNSS